MENILAVHIHAANIHDTKGGCYVFAKAMQKYPSIQAGCADEGYRGTFKRLIEAAFHVRIDISRQIKPKFEVLPKRWRVERTFSWFNNSRRLSKDYEINTVSEKNMAMISHLNTLLNRLWEHLLNNIYLASSMQFCHLSSTLSIKKHLIHCLKG